MAVPASIRAVERPSNTIVEDNGRDGPNRYAVRLRAGVKYVPGGNPQPRNGKVIGHIVDGSMSRSMHQWLMQNLRCCSMVLLHSFTPSRQTL